MKSRSVARGLCFAAIFVCVLFCCGFTSVSNNAVCSGDVSSFAGAECGTVRKSGSDNIEDGLIDSFIESLPEGMENMSDPEGIKAAIGRLSVRELLAEALSDSSFISAFLSALLAVGLVLVLAEHSSGEHNGALKASVGWVGSLVIFSLIGGVISDAARAISELSSFMSGLAPILTAALVAGGGTSAAGALSSGINITLYLISSLGEPVLLLLAISSFALGAIGSVGGGHAALCRGLRSAFFRVLGTVSAAFSGVIALQSYVSGLADSAVIRAAKHAAQNMIPIVGQGVSAALSAVMGGVSYSSGIIGSGAVAAILSLVLSPLVMLLLVRFSMSLCLILLEFCHAPSAIALFSSFVGAIDAVAAVYIMSIIVCIMHILLFVKGGARIYG